MRRDLVSRIHGGVGVSDEPEFARWELSTIPGEKPRPLNATARLIDLELDNHALRAALEQKTMNLWREQQINQEYRRELERLRRGGGTHRG